MHPFRENSLVKEEELKPEQMRQTAQLIRVKKENDLENNLQERVARIWPKIEAEIREDAQRGHFGLGYELNIGNKMTAKAVAVHGRRLGWYTVYGQGMDYKWTVWVYWDKWHCWLWRAGRHKAMISLMMVMVGSFISYLIYWR